MSYLSIAENKKLVNLAVCLGAMTKPLGMRHATIRSLVHLAPQLIFLLFGRKAMLSSVHFWINFLSPSVYARFIRLCLWELFGWRCKHITPEDQERMFPHMYTYCSVKTIVHWFQMMRHASFQMFENVNHLDGHQIPRYPLETIKTPICVFYGSDDTLCDLEYTRKALGDKIVSEHRLDGYEHLDFLFASDVHQRVYPTIQEELSKLKRK
jgi:lysosomal acid lipase/cholesteryl ester hydrolase